MDRRRWRWRTKATTPPTEINENEGKGNPHNAHKANTLEYLFRVKALMKRQNATCVNANMATSTCIGCESMREVLLFLLSRWRFDSKLIWHIDILHIHPAPTVTHTAPLGAFTYDAIHRMRARYSVMWHKMKKLRVKIVSKINWIKSPLPFSYEMRTSHFCASLISHIWCAFGIISGAVAIVSHRPPLTHRLRQIIKMNNTLVSVCVDAKAVTLSGIHTPDARCTFVADTDTVFKAKWNTPLRRLWLSVQPKGDILRETFWNTLCSQWFTRFLSPSRLWSHPVIFRPVSANSAYNERKFYELDRYTTFHFR